MHLPPTLYCHFYYQLVLLLALSRDRGTLDYQLLLTWEGWVGLIWEGSLIRTFQLSTFNLINAIILILPYIFSSLLLRTVNQWIRSSLYLRKIESPKIGFDKYIDQPIYLASYDTDIYVSANWISVSALSVSVSWIGVSAKYRLYNLGFDKHISWNILEILPKWNILFRNW